MKDASCARKEYPCGKSHPQEVSKLSLLELFCGVDDFCQEYAMMGQDEQLETRKRTRQTETQR